MVYYNLILFAIVLLLIIELGFLELGRRIGVRQVKGDPKGSKFGVSQVEGTIFTLLGLLIAFY